MEMIRFKDGNGYVATEEGNRYRRVADVNKATIFNDGAATKFIRNGVQKIFRDRMEVIHAPCAMADEPTSDSNTEKQQGNLGYFPNQTSFNSLDFDWHSKLKAEDKFRADLHTYKQQLPFMLTQVNNEIADIVHYIEFNSFSACEGYKLCKLLKDKREHRRKIKDEIETMDIIFRDWINGHNADNVYRVLANRNTRTYTPKALPQLFQK